MQEEIHLISPKLLTILILLMTWKKKSELLNTSLIPFFESLSISQVVLYLVCYGKLQSCNMRPI